MRLKKLIPVIVVLALILVACKSDEQSKDESQPETSQVSLQLGWFHEYSSSPLYAAELNRHFADQNLEVTLVEGGFTTNAIDEVLAGNVDFGLTDASSIIRARSEGKPVIAVATVLQRSPAALISLSDTEVARPQDLVGHTVTVSFDGAQMMYNTLLTSQNIKTDDVTTVERTDFGIDPLITGEVDVMSGWLINEGVMVRESGYEPNVILLSDYGVDTYDFVIFTTEDMVNSQAQVIERFVRAIAEGIEDVISNPQQAAEYALRYNDQLDLDGQLRRVVAMIPLMNVPGINLAAMQPGVWDITQQFLLEQGSLDSPIDLTTAYTTTFTDKIYQD